MKNFVRKSPNNVFLFPSLFLFLYYLLKVVLFCFHKLSILSSCYRPLFSDQESLFCLPKNYVYSAFLDTPGSLFFYKFSRFVNIHFDILLHPVFIIILLINSIIYFSLALFFSIIIKKAINFFSKS